MLTFLAATCPLGCCVGWCSSVVPEAEADKWVNSARQLGYVVSRIPSVDDVKVNLTCEHQRMDARTRK